MKKSLLALNVLFIAMACSTAPNGSDISPMQAGLNDAISRLGGIDGYTAYEHKDGYKDDLYSAETIHMLYLKDNSMKLALASIGDGTLTDIGSEGLTITFTNEVVSKSTSQETFTKTTSFELKDHSGTVITDKKGFTTLLTSKPIKQEGWGSKKLGYSGIWEEYPTDGSESYILIKEDADTLTEIWVDKKNSDGSYEIFASDLTDTKYQRIYTKK